MMQNKISKLQALYEQLLNSELLTYHEVKSLRDIMGVYLIYNTDNEIIYIGSTNKFHVRFGIDLNHESTHTLIRKLLKAGVHKDRIEAKNHFKDHYKYRIKECSNKREAEALEHLAYGL